MAEMQSNPTPDVAAPQAALAAAADPWQHVAWLPCELALQIPVAGFSVRSLLRLREGHLVSTRWSRSTEVPLRANGQIIGWVEFEPVGKHLGARITDLV